MRMISEPSRPSPGWSAVPGGRPHFRASPDIGDGAPDRERSRRPLGTRGTTPVEEMFRGRSSGNRAYCARTRWRQDRDGGGLKLSP